MYEMSSYENYGLDLPQGNMFHIYTDFMQVMGSDLFEPFGIDDIVRFADDIVGVYMHLLRVAHPIPLFSDILEDSIYFYYRRLYDVTSDYYEDYSQNKFELEDNLYMSGAYHEFMDFVYTVLNSNKLTFGYSDYDYKNIYSIIIINDAQTEIFEERGDRIGL